VSNARVATSVAPFAIGATIFAGALVTGPLTGGSFNPARSLGPAIVGGIWTSHWLYWAAPILGAVVGMNAYAIISPMSAAAAASPATSSITTRYEPTNDVSTADRT